MCRTSVTPLSRTIMPLYKRQTIINFNEDDHQTPPPPSNPSSVQSSIQRDTYNNYNQLAMIEVILNDRLGKKVRVKCNEDDTIGDLKKLAAAQLGTRPEKLKIQKWYTIYKDHITLEDYEIHDGMGLEL